MERRASPAAAGEARPADGLPRCYRPEQRLFNRGSSGLTAAELLAFLSRGRADAARPELRSLLARHGLKGIAAMKPQELRAQPGIGRATAARLAAAFELGRRVYARNGRRERRKLGRPSEAFELVRRLGRARKEQLVGLYLDAQNALLHRETISVGSLNTTRTHPREILYPAIAHLAIGFILVHNHPSGSLEPSTEDVEFTRAIRRAGELMGIELYDHLIVGGDGYTSLRERGLV